MALQIITWVLSCVFVLHTHSVHSLELINQSKQIHLMAQGTSYTLHCESDEPYEICSWEHIVKLDEFGSTEKRAKCRVTDTMVESTNETECNGNAGLIWDLTETRCGITIQNAARSDSGEYKCSLAKISEDPPAVVSASSTIDISVPSTVTFLGTFASSSSAITLQPGMEEIVTCHATGGYPEPEIQAAIGDRKNTIEVYDDAGSDTMLDVISEERNEIGDGIIELTRLFSLTTQHEHCGQFVKCEAIQKDEDGNVLFQEEDVMSRKLMIVFAPLPQEEDLPPFTFTGGDEEVRIEIMFAANPMPEDNAAIWHINPSGNASHDSHVLHAGVTDGKYQALPLNDTETGHVVQAVLIIKNPSEEDLEHYNFLEVSNDINTQQYDFELELVTADASGRGEEEDLFGKSDVENDFQGMGVGSVVAIVIVVILAMLIIGCVIYSKRAGKCCFEKYDSVPVKPEQDDNSNSRHENIIKNGGGGPSEFKEKTVEADPALKGVDETDKQIDNPV